MDQELSKVAVAAFADPSEVLFTSRGMLPWDQPKPHHGQRSMTAG